MRLGVSTDFGTHSARGWADANASLGLKSAVFPLNSSCDDGLIEEYCKAAGEANIVIAEVGIWRNTFFTIEPMPWMVPTGPEDYLQLIEEVDRDRFGVHMDVINMINCPERFFFPEEFLAKTYCELINNEDPEMPVIIEHLGSDEAYRDSVKYVSKRMAADIQSR